MLTHRGNPREDHCSPPAKNLTDTLTRYSHQVFMLVKLDEGMKALPQGKGGGQNMELLYACCPYYTVWPRRPDSANRTWREGGFTVYMQWGPAGGQFYFISLMLAQTIWGITIARLITRMAIRMCSIEPCHFRWPWVNLKGPCTNANARFRFPN